MRRRVAFSLIVTVAILLAAASSAWMRMRESPNGARFTFTRCGFTKGVIMTGRGSYDYGRDRFVLDVTLSGRFDGHYRYVRAG